VVLNFDPKTERISLGLKQKDREPVEERGGTLSGRQRVRGKVVSMTDYGAFVQLEDGIEGMVHVSEMSWTRRVRHPNEVLQHRRRSGRDGSQRRPEAEKIALGIKQTQPNPWATSAERYPVGSTVKGIVRNLTDYGAFVQIEEGIDGAAACERSVLDEEGHPSFRSAREGPGSRSQDPQHRSRKRKDQRRA
jgi:small subunit ribosomal protein S1